MKIAIKNARIYDPVTGKNGEVGEVFIDGSRIVEALEAPDLNVDAGGRILMAGAIDLNAQIASYGLSFLRSRGLAPALRTVAEDYVRLGYTFVAETFVTPQTAGYTHYELSALSWLNKSAVLSVPLFDLENYIRNENVEKCARMLGGLGELTKCIGFRIFEPELYYEQEIYSHRNIEASKLIEFFARVSDVLKLRFFVYPYASTLGLISTFPENYHICHVSDFLDSGELVAVEDILVRDGSIDLGCLPVGKYLKVTLHKPDNPGIFFKLDVGLTHSVYYCVEGGPQDHDGIIEFLAGNEKNRISFSMMPPTSELALAYATSWAEIVNRWGFYLLARLTRSSPAEALGISDRGNLKPGSRGDVVIYDIRDEADMESMKKAFSSCWCLIRDGEVVVSDGKIIGPEKGGSTWYRDFPGSNREEALKVLSQSSFRAENLEVMESISGRLSKLNIP